MDFILKLSHNINTIERETTTLSVSLSLFYANQTGKLRLNAIPVVIRTVAKWFLGYFEVSFELGNQIKLGTQYLYIF